MRARVVGVGLRDKRARILRSLEAHRRWLEVAATLAPWTPPVRAPYAERPRRVDWTRALPAYVYPRERPELARPCPGPEALSEEEVKAWVAADAFVRGGLSAATQRSMTFLETFKKRTEPHVG